MELLDSGDNLLATGVAAGNLDSVISRYVVGTGGVYYARVTGPGGEYNLVVTRDAAFDTEATMRRARP